jgi:hypothetical protein
MDGGLPRLAIFNANNEDVDQGLHENPSRKRKKTLPIGITEHSLDDWMLDDDDGLRILLEAGLPCPTRLAPH